MNEQERIKKDLEMIMDRTRWIHWPILPLKKKGGFFETGYMVDTRPFNPTIRKGNIFNLKKDDPIIQYDSFEELLKDWMVD